MAAFNGTRGVLNNIKINENQHIGKQELVNIIKLLKEEGVEYARGNMITQHGIIRSKNADPNFNFFLVEPSVAGSAEAIVVRDGIAIDEFGNLLVHGKPSVLGGGVDISEEKVIPFNTSRYVFISHSPITHEMGYVDVAANGTVTATGDGVISFTQWARAFQNYPMKVRFPNSLNNTGEYEVNLVVSDTEIRIVTNAALVPETDQRITCVGSFNPSKTIPPSSKDIYEFAGINIRLGDTDVPQAGEILLALAQNSAGVITVTDLRSNSIFQPQVQVGIGVVKTQTLKEEFGVVGMEWEQYGSSSRTNIYKIGWGLMATSYNYNTVSRTIKITSFHSGGKYLDNKAAIVAGASVYVGWRLYDSSLEEMNKYAKILAAADDGAGNLDLTVDIPLNEMSGAIMIVPDSDYIELIYGNGNTGVAYPMSWAQTIADAQNYRSFMFPIASQSAVLELPVKISSGLNARMKWRYVQDGVKTELLPIAANSPLSAAAFNESGIETGATTLTVNANGEWTPSKRGWTTVTYQNDWAAPVGRDAQYTKDGDVVYLRGNLISDNPPTSNTMFTLPEGFRPNKKTYLSAVFLGSDPADDREHVVVSVDTNGAVVNEKTSGGLGSPSRPADSTWILDGLSFILTS